MKSPYIAPAEVAIAWSTELYEPGTSELGGPVIDDSYGVPYRSQEAIKEALATTVRQMGIELGAVLFSGYNFETAHQVSESDINPELAVLTRKILKLQDQGAFESDPQLKLKYQKRLSIIKERSGLKTYYFNDYEGLSDSPEDSSNPIHYAGTNDDAVIGVYDKKAIAEFQQDENSPIFSVGAKRDLIENAKILEFHPRFKL
jgi:hypothetical protein